MPKPNLKKLQPGADKIKQGSISRFFTQVAENERPTPSKVTPARQAGSGLSPPESHNHHPAGQKRKDPPHSIDVKVKKSKSREGDEGAAVRMTTETGPGIKNSLSTQSTSSKSYLSQTTFNKLHNFSYESCCGHQENVSNFSHVPLQKVLFKETNQQKHPDTLNKEGCTSPSVNKEGCTSPSVQTDGGSGHVRRPDTPPTGQASPSLPDGSPRGSRGSAVRKVKCKYTPLEQQFIDIKSQHPGVLLFVECGYKYRFFGEDAEIAARELNIFCHMDHNFMTASIPVTRLFVHVRRLVTKGHKVGVVKQVETAALKAAGDNRSAPFTRKLAALYTKATLIGEDVSPEPEEEVLEATKTSYIMCVYESSLTDTRNTQHQIGIVAVQPSTGEIIYDCFTDGPTRQGLETRLAHIRPVELLLPTSLNPITASFLKQVVANSSTDDDRIRTEVFEDKLFDYRKSLENIQIILQSTKRKQASLSTASSSPKESGELLDVVKLDRPVVSCLNVVMHYLKMFQLDQILSVSGNIHPFSARAPCMRLSACTLRNLEVFHNQSGGKEGSLLSVLDHTVTVFGSRMLQQWLTKPLQNKQEIDERLDAVSELVQADTDLLADLEACLTGLPDMERSLCSALHKKCSTYEFFTLGNSLAKVYKFFKRKGPGFIKAFFSQPLVKAFEQLPSLLEGVDHWTESINEQSARENDKTKLFKDESHFPSIISCKEKIAEILRELKDHRREVRLTLHQPSLDYITVMGTQFLIEVKKEHLHLVPSDWVQISSVKAASRFHTPFILDACKQLNQQKEHLKLECDKAWQVLLDEFSECYIAYRDSVRHVAAVDCFLSLCRVARQEGYTRPRLVDDTSVIDIRQGRHPVVEKLLHTQQQYVPNNTQLKGRNKQCMVITGPNMGGKSSYIKQVALITLMTHIGSFVPAESAEIGIVDAICTRMGASDDLYGGRSTFMVELEETADIINMATSRSLVILDELGRGTSTHDGVAIAQATLKYFATEVDCLTLFVTHYPPVTELEKLCPDLVENYHMSFHLKDSTDTNIECLTLLYQLCRGIAHRSYGLTVAQLAGIPDQIITMAADKSQQLEDCINKKRRKTHLVQRVRCCQQVDGLLSVLQQTEEN